MKQQNDSTQEVLNMVLEELAKERTLRIAAEKTIEAQKGKVLFADAVTACGKSILVREMANILKQSGIETGEGRLFQWLREHEYLYRLPCGDNRPTQKSLELGVMELYQRLKLNPNGRSHIYYTVKITPRGQIYFMDVLTRHKEEINAKEAAKKQKAATKYAEKNRKKRLEELEAQEAQKQGA